MSSTSVTLYDVNIYVDGKWDVSLRSYSRKDALAHAEALNKSGAKWSLWKRTERSEMIGKG